MGATDESSFVVAISDEFRDNTAVFSSYGRRGEAGRALFDGVKIWEAARATSAATTFFDPAVIKVGRITQKFVDGAVGANNPVDILWNEARRLWATEQGTRIEDKVACVVSIGTGKPAAEAFGHGLDEIYRTLKAVATETERTAEKFQENHQDLEQRNGYYRFNVDRGLERVALEDHASLNLVHAATTMYGNLGGTRRMMERFAGVVKESSMSTTTRFELDGA